MNQRLLCLPRLLIIARSYHVNQTSTTIRNERKIIDLRSDTVTKPCANMLTRMFDANVGDDVFNEDPTVNELEVKCAELFGMEKALFVPSGTMGNLLCIMSHCTGRGQEIIIGADQHVYFYEQGNFTQFGSIPAFVIPNENDGTLCLQKVENSIRDDSDFHQSETKLICLENTHMRSGGIPLSLDYLNQVGQLAKNKKIQVHIDGARIYNAAVALNCSVKNLLTHADSVSMCLSKGLGCPIGSVIGGSEVFINRALRLRKSLGGGLRQSGFLAAAGLYALENADKTLFADHEKAKLLANGIKEIKNEELVCVDIKTVKTNIVFVKTKINHADQISGKLASHGLLSTPFDASTIRLVTHLDVSNEDINNAVDIIHTVAKEMS